MESERRQYILSCVHYHKDSINSLNKELRISKSYLHSYLVEGRDIWDVEKQLYIYYKGGNDGKD